MQTITEFGTICRRSRSTLVDDALGAAALGVMLIVALHVPSVL